MIKKRLLTVNLLPVTLDKPARVRICDNAAKETKIIICTDTRSYILDAEKYLINIGIIPESFGYCPHSQTYTISVDNENKRSIK